MSNWPNPYAHMPSGQLAGLDTGVMEDELYRREREPAPVIDAPHMSPIFGENHKLFKCFVNVLIGQRGPMLGRRWASRAGADQAIRPLQAAYRIRIIPKVKSTAPA